MGASEPELVGLLHAPTLSVHDLSGGAGTYVARSEQWKRQHRCSYGLSLALALLFILWGVHGACSGGPEV